MRSWLLLALLSLTSCDGEPSALDGSVARDATLNQPHDAHLAAPLP
ncbi:MAG: hypothetical protein RLO52_06565 [Sandaracinaceae bacterium]